MPNAIVATMTTPSSRRNRDWFAARIDGVETRVVRQRVDALRAQVLRRLLDALAAQRVDDARGALGLRADEREQLLARLDLRVDAVLDVRPVEARDEVLRVGQPQALGDLAVRRVGRGRGERDARDAGELLAEIAEREVVGAEVVAPLRHAVRFVDRDDAQRAALQQGARGRAREPLGGDVDQVELAGEVRALDRGALGRAPAWS